MLVIAHNRIWADEYSRRQKEASSGSWKVSELSRPDKRGGRMQPRRILENLQRAEQGQLVGGVLHGRSSIVGAMGWMLGLSFLLTLALGWVPFVGPFIGPAVGGYLGGRRAGSVGGALGAAILPAVLLSLFIFGIGLIASTFAGRPIIGAFAVVIAGALWVILIIHNALLVLSALVGGLIRQLEGP
jgi:hypothetical protein